MGIATYEEHHAPAHLSPLIAAVWQIRGSSTECKVRRILPDGCADVIIDLAQWQQTGVARILAVGPMTKAVLVPSGNDMDLVGVRFRPGAGRGVVATNFAEMLDAVVPLERATVKLPISCEQMFRAPSIRSRADLILQSLTLNRTDWPQCPDTVLEAMYIWRTAARALNSIPTVATVAREIRVGERRLERLFSRWTGYTPVQFRRLVRFRAAIRMAQANRHSWTDVATRCGYADQAHLTRDFQAFACTTPTIWAKEQRTVGYVQDGQVTAL